MEMRCAGKIPPHSEAYLQTGVDSGTRMRVGIMGFLIAMLMTAISLFAPINAFAQSDDVESTI